MEKNVDIYGNGNKLFIINAYEDNGADIYAKCEELGVKDYKLFVISGLSWDEELSPWPIDPLYKGDNFTGGADEYLKEMLQIISFAEEKYQEIYLVGYSLAGLFSLYAISKTNLFNGVASISGSLWYPDFDSYLLKKDLCKNIDYAYFSLGDKEANTKNALMARVKDKTETIITNLRKQGLKCFYEENEGNHFKDSELRIAKAIYALSNKKADLFD